jgi:myosin heavy subunit
LAFLTDAANKEHHVNDHSTPQEQSTSSLIADRIIAASPILEAFGNAQTSRNPNSSRFGKWMVLNFDRHNVIQSSHIVSYLLEKSRVTQRDAKERNYHIFYQLLQGLTDERLDEYELSRFSLDYRLLVADQENGENAIDLNDAANFKHTHAAFLTMGFTEEEIYEIYSLVIGILELGNILFRESRDGESAEIVNMDPVDRAAKKLGVDSDVLLFSLTNRSIESGPKHKKTITNIPLKYKKAIEARDSLAKNIYEKLFLEIIQGINSKSVGKHGSDLTIDRRVGLLDIFGFEIFTENSFEQLCINYCNEMLQNHFNYVVFIAEKNLYDSESIHCDQFEFRDNIQVIKDIESLFKALDEEGRIPNGTSKTWYDKLKRSSSKSAHIAFPPRRQGDVFAVKHYAGDVDYQAVGFLDKNVETMNNDVVATMSGSQNNLVVKLFCDGSASAAVVEGSNATEGMSSSQRGSASAGTASTSSLNQKSLSWRFQQQLTSLMAMLKKTQSHFIRCVKSNDECQSQVFESSIVHRQLLYSGVFEVVKIQQSGLPCRMPHKEFLDKFKCLVCSKTRYQLKSSADLLKALLQQVVLQQNKNEAKKKYDLGQAKSGRTQLFLKSYEQRLLEMEREYLLQISSSHISCFLLMKHVRSRFIRIRDRYREFQWGNQALSSAPATVALQALVLECATMHNLLRRPVLQPLIEKLRRELSLLDRRVELIADAKEMLNERSEAAMIMLHTVLHRADELELHWHGVIKTSAERVRSYHQMLDFLAVVQRTYQTNDLTREVLQDVPLRRQSHRFRSTSSSAYGLSGEDSNSEEKISETLLTLHDLSKQQVVDGITMLEAQIDFLPASGKESLMSALHHRRLIEEEQQLLFTPIKRLYGLSATQYDASTGELVLKFDDEGFNAYEELKTYVEPLLQGKLPEIMLMNKRTEVAQISSASSYVFLTADMKQLFEYCRCFVYLMENFVAAEIANPAGALEWIASSACSDKDNAVFQNQVDEVHKWAEIQLAPNRLNELLAVGAIQRRDMIVSSDRTEVLASDGQLALIEFEDIEILLSKLQVLTQPSETTSKVIRAGEWIVKVSGFKTRI